jgi:hypothetical protein
MYVYIYIHTHTYICICTGINMHITVKGGEVTVEIFVALSSPIYRTSLIRHSPFIVVKRACLIFPSRFPASGPDSSVVT